MSLVAAPRETYPLSHVGAMSHATKIVHALRATTDRVKSVSTRSVPQVISCLVQGCLRKAPSPSGTQNKPSCLAEARLFDERGLVLTAEYAAKTGR